MPQFTKRTWIIIASALIFFSVLSALFIQNWIDYQSRLQFLSCDDPTGCITIYGEVREEQRIGYDYLTNNATFEYFDNIQTENLNSWGTEWGNHGYGWLPYDYVRTHLAGDFWTIMSPEWLDSGEFWRPEL